MTKNIIITAAVALVISLVVGFSLKPADRSTLPQDEQVGSVRLVADEYPNGIKIGDITYDTIFDTMATGTDEVIRKNKTGKDQFVTFAELRTLTAATSSSYRLWLYATSSALTPALYDFTALTNFASHPTGFLIGGIKLATSTVATSTTSRFEDQRDASVAYSGIYGTNSNVKWPRDWYLITFIQTLDCFKPVPASNCTAATSTLRGATLQTRIEYHD